MQLTGELERERAAGRAARREAEEARAQARAAEQRLATEEAQARALRERMAAATAAREATEREASALAEEVRRLKGALDRATTASSVEVSLSARVSVCSCV